MLLRQPFYISSRLIPAVKVGDLDIQIERAECARMRRRFKCYFSDGKNEHEESVYVCSNSYVDAIESLLSFMGAAAEAYRYGERSENWDMFPEWLMEQCYLQEDELSYLSLEIKENHLIVENERS